MDNILKLHVGEKYTIPELGEGVVKNILPDHYEIYFENIKKLKLISKNGKDLSFVKTNNLEKTFEKEKELFLNMPLLFKLYPKNVKLCLESANIITTGQLLNISDEEISKLVLCYEISIQQYIIEYIIKEKNRVINYLINLEKEYTNPPKPQVYTIPREERQYFKDKKEFINKHQIDKEDYYEEMYWEKNIKRCRFINKNEITYELIHKLDNEIVKLIFFENLKKETINDLPNPDLDKSLTSYQYWHFVKANYLIGYLVSEFDEIHFNIQNKLQKVVQQTVRNIKNNKKVHIIL